MTTAAVRRGRPRSEAADAAIIEATVDELIDRGRHGMSMESVAQRAGVAKTTLYRRYDSLDDLMFAAMNSFHFVVDEPPPGSTRDQLVWLLEVMRRKWGNPRYAAMMRRVSADGTDDPQRYRRTRDRLIGPHVRRMDAVLRRAVERGTMRSDVDLEWVRQMLTGPIVAASVGHRPRVTATQVEATVDIVLRGLEPRSGLAG